MAKIPYFPFYPDDWLSSSRIDLLTADQERGYLRLLARSWNMPDCTLPDNETLLLRWARMSSADDLRALCGRCADGMEPLFERVEKGWKNPKLYSLWLKAQDKHEKAVENASARYNKKSEPADAERTQSGRRANQNQNQNQLKEEPKDSTPRKKREASAPKLSDAEWLESLKASPAYEGIDVDREYHKCAAWCVTANRTSTRRTFVNWLNRTERPLKGGENAGLQKQASGGQFRSAAERRSDIAREAREESRRRLGICGVGAGMAPDLRKVSGYAAGPDRASGVAGEMGKEIIDCAAVEVEANG